LAQAEAGYGCEALEVQEWEGGDARVYEVDLGAVEGVVV